MVQIVIPALVAGLAVSCSAGPPAPGSESVAHVSQAAVGGCSCVGSGSCDALTYNDIPADSTYYVTTFGGGADTQTMSCGGTADGTWAYAADRSRFGCGAKLLVQASGKQCVVEVADCGPNRCVEQAACNCSCGGHHPVLDVSPMVTQYLMGTSAVGWSEYKAVTADLIDPSSTIGCPGVAVGTGGTGGSGGGGTGGTGGGGGFGGGGFGGSGAGGFGGSGAGGFGGSGAGGFGGSGATGTGGSSTGGSGTGGSGTGGGCNVAPDCNGCVGCVSQCVCQLGSVQSCNTICNSGGSAGAGGSSASGGSGGAASCAVPTCYVCPDCYSRCMCVAGDQKVCTGVCNQPQGAGGGSGGGAALGSPGCTGSDCGSCATCADHCTCVTHDATACASACGSSGATTGTKTVLDPVSRCECSTPGRPSDGEGGAWFAFAVIGCVLLRRDKRERRERG